MFARLRHIALPEPPAPAWDRKTILYALLLLGIGLRIGSGLEAHMDILFWDEANYLNRGLWMFDRIPRVWGPAYSAWYKLLSFAESDKIALYYLNYRLMSVGVALMAFIFLTAYGIRAWIAFLLSTGLLLSAYNLPVWPKISHFCILVVMASAVIARRLNDRLAQWSLFTLAALLTAYARPELFLFFLACLVVLLVVSLQRFKASNRNSQLLFVCTLILALLVCWYYRTPFNSGDAGRSIKVFYQHFSLNFIQWNGLDRHWWLDWQDIIATNFKHPESLAGILRYDGALFLRHITSNAVTLLRDGLSMTAQLFVPWTAGGWVTLLFGVSGIALLLSAVRTNGSWVRLKAALHENARPLFLLLLFVSPGVLVCLYAYPRAHYLVIFLPLLLLLCGLVLNSLPEGDGGWRANGTLLAGAILFLFSPKAEAFDFFDLERDKPSLVNVQTIRYLQQLEPADTLRIFDLEGDVSAMLSGKYRGYTNEYLQAGEPPVPEYLERNRIDVVYVTPVLTAHRKLRGDSAYLKLLAKPEEFHYHIKKIGNFTSYLLIHLEP